MIWLQLVLATLAEPIVHGDAVLRPVLTSRNGGGKSAGKWILRHRDLGPTAAPRAMRFEDWDAIADKIRARKLEAMGERGATR